MAEVEAPSPLTQEEESSSKTEEQGMSSMPNGGATVPVPPKLRYDWYQTQSDVYVNIMMKDLKKEDVQVVFTEGNVSVAIKQSGGSDLSLQLNLANSVVQAKCSYKVLRTKVELKMRKAEGLRWKTLERCSESTTVHKYPTSSHHHTNWDKLEAEMKKEEKEEKLEGDAALNRLFQQIYGDGSDEVRRAMNKSFVESGGTVLSTNWKEVGDKAVGRKPPEGMEWKSYES